MANSSILSVRAPMAPPSMSISHSVPSSPRVDPPHSTQEPSKTSESTTKRCPAKPSHSSHPKSSHDTIQPLYFGPNLSAKFRNQVGWPFLAVCVNSRKLLECLVSVETGSWLAGSWLAGSWLAGSWLAGSWLAGSWLAGSWLAVTNSHDSAPLDPV
ncbi:MAG: hypothetical protein ACI8T1_001594 [Verrucomicrobiales bacterium]|jgi:hypothetical protein